MWIACQLRLSTSTIVLFSMSVIKLLRTVSTFRREVLVLCRKEIGCLARFCSRSSGVRDRRAPDYATRHLKVVAWEGSAPSISGCRPEVMLFHHQAVEARLADTGCLAWICTKTDGVKTRYAAC